MPTKFKTTPRLLFNPNAKHSGEVQLDITTVKRAGELYSISKQKGNRVVVKEIERISEYETKTKIMQFDIKSVYERDGNKYAVIGGLSRGYKEYTTTYNDIGMSHVDRGFTSLCNHLQADGVSKDEIEQLTSEWNQLSSKEKGEVFNKYNNRSNNKVYGSDSLDPFANSHASAKTYFNDLYDIVGSYTGENIGV